MSKIEKFVISLNVVHQHLCIMSDSFNSLIRLTDILNEHSGNQKQASKKNDDSIRLLQSLINNRNKFSRINESEYAATLGFTSINERGFRRLKKKYLDFIVGKLLINYNLDSYIFEIENSFNYSSKLIVIAQYLLRNEELEIAELFINRALDICETYNLTQLKNLALRLKLKLFETSDKFSRGLQKKYFQLISEIKTSEQILARETVVNDIFFRVEAIVCKKKIDIEELDQLNVELEDWNSKKAENLHSYLSLRKYYLIKKLISEEKRNLQEVSVICNSAIAKLQSYKQYEGEFHISLLETEIELGSFSNCNFLLQDMQIELKPWVENWFRLKALEFLIYCRNNNFKSALEIYNQVKSNSYYKSQSFEIQEEWIINEAYLFILEKFKIIKGGNNRRFRISKFMNEIPEAVKKKDTLNIHARIIEIVSYIVINKTDKVFDLLYSTNQYVFRYLKKDKNYRAKTFLKMLMKIPDGGFNPKRVQRYAKKYTDLLYKSKNNFLLSNNRIEIIEYNFLWEQILKFLESK